MLIFSKHLLPHKLRNQLPNFRIFRKLERNLPAVVFNCHIRIALKQHQHNITIPAPNSSMKGRSFIWKTPINLDMWMIEQMSNAVNVIIKYRYMQRRPIIIRLRITAGPAGKQKLDYARPILLTCMVDGPPAVVSPLVQKVDFFANDLTLLRLEFFD